MSCVRSVRETQTKGSPPLDSKVREASEVESREAGLHNEENKKIHELTQSVHNIEHSASDLMIPPANRQAMGLEDREKGIVYTGAGLVPMVPDHSTRSYAEKLMAIKPAKTESELEERKGAATLSWMKEKGMIAPASSADSLDGSNNLPAMNKDESVYYKVNKNPGHTLIEGGIQEQHQIEELPPSPPNFMKALSPEMRAGVIAAFQKGGQVGEQAINETAEDILQKTAQGSIDTIKAPLDMVIAAGKGLWGILEFERDLMFDPERAQKTAATAGDYIGKALVAGIVLWAGGSKYVSDVQQKGDYKQPFRDLGVAINNWYDGLTPGDQMHAMAIISTGFGMGAAAGELRRLSKPGAFVEFVQETAQALPKNPEAQAKAAESIKKLIEIFSRAHARKLSTAGGPAIDATDDMLNMQRRIYKSPKTGREITLGKAAEEAGIDKTLSPVEKVKELLRKGWDLIEPKKYHVDGCAKPLSEAEMAKSLNKEISELRAMTAEELEANGITAIEQVNGAFPRNWKLAGKVIPLDKKFVKELVDKYPKLSGKGLENGIEFAKNGYPRFSEFAKYSVEFPDKFSGDRKLDAKLANAFLGLKETPKGYTWHHCSDQKTLELIPAPLHEKIRHSGGHAMSKELR